MGKLMFGYMGVPHGKDFSDTTDEWQFIRSFHISQVAKPKVLSVDDKMYVLSTLVLNRGMSPDTSVECYDPDKDKWERVTDVPVLTRPYSQSVVNVYYIYCQLESIASNPFLGQLTPVVTPLSCHATLGREGPGAVVCTCLSVSQLLAKCYCLCILVCSEQTMEYLWR